MVEGDGLGRVGGMVRMVVVECVGMLCLGKKVVGVSERGHDWA